MATLTVQEPTLAGITPTYAAVTAGGDEFAYSGGDILIHVKNSGTQQVVTVVTPATIEGVAIDNPTVTIPATTGDKMIKLTAPGNLFVPADGKIDLTYDGAGGMTIAVFKV